MIFRAYTLLVTAKLLGALGGLLSAEVIARRLSFEQQGLFYSYFSLISFYFVFDSFSQLLLVRVSHHADSISIEEKSIVGVVPDELSGLIRKSLIWAVSQTVIATIVIALVGCSLFRHSANHQITAWLLACAGSFLTSFLIPGLAILEGLGKVAEVAIIRILQTLSMHAATLIALKWGAGLHALGFGLIVMSLVSAGLILPWKNVFHRLLSAGIPCEWYTRIWPAQWRLYIVGLSVFCCGGLPVLLIREFIGEEEAGKFGMTHKILEMILFFGATAFTTGIHQLGKCYAAHDKHEFFRTGKKLIRAGLLIVAATSIVAWLGLQLATLIGLQFPHRMVSSPILAIMLVTTLIVCQNWGMEILIRSNGEEMLWPQYLARAVVCLPLLVFAIQYAGLMGAALVLFAIPLCLVLPWNLSLLRSFKRKWNSCQ